MENKLPITRLSKFFSEDDYNLHIQMGMEYLHGDLNMKVVLYSVDREKTGTDDVYDETNKDNIKFFPPIEFNALVLVVTAENKSYKSGFLRYLEPGNMIVSVYTKTLEDLGIEIKFGDYLGYADSEKRVRFYNVVNDGRVNADNKHHHFGYKPSYRTIICSPVQENEFRGV